MRLARSLAGLFASSALTISGSAAADPAIDPPAPSSSSMPTPFDRLGPNLADAFTGWNLIYYGSAGAATGLMVWGGADHAIRHWMQLDLRAPAYGDISYYTGYIAPFVIAPGVYFVGLILRDRTLAGAGAAATQALAVTAFTTGALKVATGRVFPTNGGDPNDPARLQHPEYARDWTPFGLDGRYAWPSGHTSTTISIAASLSAYYDDRPWVPLVTYPIALAIGIGMIDGDHHWASDVVAGGLIGQAIGWSIGRNFRHLVRDPKPEAARWHLLPLVGSSFGLVVAGEL